MKLVGFLLFAWLAGCGLIVSMSMTPFIKAPLFLWWMVVCGYQWFRHVQAAKRVALLRVNSDGQVVLFAKNGQFRRGLLARGTLVLQRFAWLRIDLENGSHHAELLSGCAVEDANWHRLQLIWQQNRQLIGGVSAN